MNLPLDSEWDFRDVRRSEAWACFVFEYVREALFRDPDGRLLMLLDLWERRIPKRLKRGGLGGTMVDSKLQPVPAVVGRVVAQVPKRDRGRPFFDLSAKVRGQLRGEFPAPSASPRLESNFEAISEWSAHVDASDPRWWEGHLSGLRVFPLVVPKGLGVREVERRFSAWLKERVARDKAFLSGRSRRHGRKWTPEEMLRALAARRWLAMCGTVAELRRMASTEVSDYLLRDQDDSEIYRLVRKADAAVDAVLADRLQSFRTP